MPTTMIMTRMDMTQIRMNTVMTITKHMGMGMGMGDTTMFMSPQVTAVHSFWGWR
ncbi:hypothetical protein [Asaia sp. SF2.1]|uniref:hypothetical protein n=1 Tax=Asaia sp. SF2.1 TaxID=406101 RepID=UPI000413DA2E